MGSTLTNTQPKDTYKSLLKTSDSSELSATLKAVSDGNGNDSALSLSTSAIKVTGSITGTNGFNGFAGATHNLLLDWSASSQFTTLTATDIFFGTNANERMRITSDGYVRLAAGTGGIQFGGDTASANALNDYEEGLWSMGVSFGGASVGVTYGSNSGAYTKVGRQVTVTGYLALSNKGSSTGAVRITGLPFTIGSGNQFQSVGSMRTENITFADVIQCNSVTNGTSLDLTETTNAGVVAQILDTDFSNNSVIFLHFTYFV